MPPNIVVVTAHDLGRYLGCYGRDVQTPNIDRLAAEGVTFENAFCSSPTCMPSRSSIETGLLPHNNGVFGHLGESPYNGWDLNDGVRTTPSYLAEEGYTSHLCGFQHVTGDRNTADRVEKLRYDEVHLAENAPGMEDAGARNVATLACEAIRDAGGDDRPFYLQANTHNVHVPFSTRASGHRNDLVPGFDSIAPEEVDVPDFLEDSEPIRRALVQFQEDVYELDYAVGEILDALAEEGIEDETLVVFTSDHGLPFGGGAKSTCFDPGMEVALLARLPGTIDPGTREDTLVSNVDLLPTLVDAAGGTVPEELDGQSLWPLLRGEPYDERKAVFCEVNWLWFSAGDCPAYTPMRAVRTQDYKCVRNFWVFDVGKRHFGAPFDSDTGVPDGFYGAFDNRDGYRPEAECYHLDEDPNETEDVLDDPEHAQAVERLRDTLRSKLKADRDPILDGPIAPGNHDIHCL